MTLPSLALLLPADGSIRLAPANPESAITGQVSVMRLPTRDMLVSQVPNLRQFNTNASALAGSPVFGDVVVLPVRS